MSSLLENYCNIMVDIYSTPSVPTSWYEHYLDELSISTIPFSEWFEHTSHSQLVDMNDGERVSLVSLSTLKWDFLLRYQASSTSDAVRKRDFSYASFITANDICVSRAFVRIYQS